MAPEEPTQVEAVIAEEDAAISVADTGDTGEGGKLKMIVQLVKKCLGVKDIAAMRLSLPASLLEPVPNLEFSQYLDRPDMFAVINEYDDAFDRMLAAVRFAYTKDLKWVHGKVCKPYNSVLGEHFRSHWDFQPAVLPADRNYPPITLSYTDPSSSIPIVTSPTLEAPPVSSETDSVNSGRSSKSIRSGSSTAGGKSPSTPATSFEAQMSNLSLGIAGSSNIRVVYVTEQISHHPPISAYYGYCPARQIEMMGIDHITAKVSGTTVRVGPGMMNKGVFVKIVGGHGEGEQYQITHPVAAVNGILRGSFYVTVADSTTITCTGGKGSLSYRAILEYKEESWLGKPHFLVDGIIHTVHDGETAHEEWTKIKHVPRSRVVAVFEGTWRGFIRWRRTENFYATSSVSSSPSPSHTHLPISPLQSVSASKADLSRIENDWIPLIDLAALKVMPKTVRPLEKQLPHESRRLWEKVTSRLLKKEYSDATKEKVAIEQKQRDEAAERKKKGIEFIPRYFGKDIEPGIPVLTAEGRKAVEEELLEGLSLEDAAKKANS